MRILSMMLPRLERLADMAGDAAVARDPVAVGELRESYRYLASVCRTILPGLEPELGELPPTPVPSSPVAARVTFQMGLVRRTNRLYRAVEAHLAESAALRVEKAVGAGG